MPKRIIFKPKTNVPLVGVVSAAYYNHSEVAKKEGWAAQLKLVGTWEIDGTQKDGDVYLPLGILGDMVDKGFIHAEAVEGEPDKYQILMPNTRIQLLREEDGTKKLTRFSIVDGSQAPQEPPESTNAPEKASAPTLRDLMAEIETKYAVCLAMSAYQHVNLYACPTINLDMRSVQAGAATMMIEMSRHGVKPTTAMLKALRKRLADASLTAAVEEPLEVI